MSGLLLAAGAQAAGNVAQGVLSYIGQTRAMRQQRRNVDKTIKANRELAQYEHEKNLEMWHLQNEYNHPRMQVARMKQGGLNPALLYGTGTVANTASQIPQYSRPNERYDYGYVDPSVASSHALDAAMKIAQINNVDAQTKKINAETPGSQATSRLQQLMTEWEELFADKRAILTSEAQIALNREGISNTQYQLNKQQLDKGKIEIALENLRLEWMQDGITPSDNILFRQIVQSGTIPDEIKGAVIGTALLAVPGLSLAKMGLRSKKLTRFINRFLNKNKSLQKGYIKRNL